MSIEYACDDGIARIRFDDGKANAMRTDWFRALNDALDRAEKDGARAVVLRGRTGMFSGGLDVKWVPTLSGDAAHEMVETFSATMLRVWTFPIPTVAEITGHAVAGGCVLACACDRRLALDGPYRIQMNEVLVRIALPSWARAICASAFGPPWLDRLALLAEPLSPERCYDLGVVESLSETPEELHQAALAAARACAALDPHAFAVSKQRARAAEAERVKALVFSE